MHPCQHCKFVHWTHTDRKQIEETSLHLLFLFCTSASLLRIRAAMMSMNVQRPKRQLLVLSVSVFSFQGIIVMKSNIYYVLGNPQCSKGWIAIINSWLYDGLTDDNDINYKAQYWPSLESTIRWWNDRKGPSGWSKIWSLVNRWLQSMTTKECGCDSDVYGVVWNTVWLAIQVIWLSLMPLYIVILEQYIMDIVVH